MSADDVHRAAHQTAAPVGSARLEDVHDGDLYPGDLDEDEGLPGLAGGGGP